MVRPESRELPSVGIVLIRAGGVGLPLLLLLTLFYDGGEDSLFCLFGERSRFARGGRLLPFSPWHNREGTSEGAGILWGPPFVVVVDVVVGMMFLL